MRPNIVYAGTQIEGLFRSTDYGDTWKKVGTGLSGAITFLTTDPNTSGRLFAPTGKAFYLSEDSGETWTNVLNISAWTVTIDPSSPLTVYATARAQGVLDRSLWRSNANRLDCGHCLRSIRRWRAGSTGSDRQRIDRP